MPECARRDQRPRSVAQVGVVLLHCEADATVQTWEGNHGLPLGQVRRGSAVALVIAESGKVAKSGLSAGCPLNCSLSGVCIMRSCLAFSAVLPAPGGRAGSIWLVGGPRRRSPHRGVRRAAACGPRSLGWSGAARGTGTAPDQRRPLRPGELSLSATLRLPPSGKSGSAFSGSWPPAQGGEEWRARPGRGAIPAGAPHARGVTRASPAAIPVGRGRRLVVSPAVRRGSGPRW